jgi:hypothetical protein
MIGRTGINDVIRRPIRNPTPLPSWPLYTWPAPAKKNERTAADVVFFSALAGTGCGVYTGWAGAGC